MLVMLFMLTTASCFVLSGCRKTDKAADDSGAVVQIEEEEVVEEEPED